MPDMMLRGQVEAMADEFARRALSVEADGFEIADTNGTFVSPINGEYSDMLFAAAGLSSPAGSLLLVIFISSWILSPVALLQTNSFFTLFGVRSDFIFYGLFGLVMPLVVLASGVLVGRDLFVWLKVLSLTAAAITFAQIKYVFPPANRIVTIMGKEMRMSFLYSQLGHGILVLNMAEAVLWEATQLQGQGYNYINAITGGIQTISVLAFARRYGFSVKESNEEQTRELRANLSPTFILAYTFWNTEYNAAYHSEKAAYYIVATLLMPLIAAVLGLHDWLEIRAIALLQAILLRVFPLNISSSVNATLFLWIDGFESEVFRYIFASLSAVWTVFLLIEIFLRINTGGNHFELPFGLSARIDVDERHPETYYRDGDDITGTGKVMASDI